MRAASFAFGLLMVSAPLAMAEEPIKWTVSVSGGSQIEIPSFFVNGKVELVRVFAEGKKFQPKDYPDVQLRQYQANSTLKPFEYIEAMLVNDDADYQTDYELSHPIDKVTYKLDKPSLGAISGTYANDALIFYGMCQEHGARTVTCFDMVWNKKDQAIFGPIAERIARSFRKNR